MPEGKISDPDMRMLKEHWQTEAREKLLRDIVQRLRSIGHHDQEAAVFADFIMREFGGARG